LPLSALTAQASSLIEAWKYSSDDHLLHVNALIAPLAAGSAVEFLHPFNADSVCRRLAVPFQENRGIAKEITILTMVPTMYSRFCKSYRDLPSDLQAAVGKAISPGHLRLNISGSAALPTPLAGEWSRISSGNVLLERYGMTEIGMALSCGLDFHDRIDASVGWPLPSVEVCLVDLETGKAIELGEELDEQGRERQGEIYVRGPTVFQEYWRNPEATDSEFVDLSDGKGKWFKTGDIAVRRTVPGTGQTSQIWARGPMYFIQGRRSSDIIKTGGEKVSALEVERELLSL
jgi:malonyl-CoA/methylmalonyl-CoA synthetase